MGRWSAGERSRVKSTAGTTLGVDHAFEREPVRGRHLRGSAAVARLEDLVHGARVEAAISHRDKRPDKSPNHLVQERVCPHRDVDPITDPSDRQPFQPPNRAARLRPPTERCEIVFPEKRARRLPHRGDAEVTRPMPNEPSLERVRPRRRVDPISVLASGGRVPSVEPLRRPPYFVGNDLGRQHAVDRPLEAFEIDPRVRDERRHLPSSMHTRVGSARDRELEIFTQDT